jgi:glucose/arabinose dehydrogenase
MNYGIPNDNPYFGNSLGYYEEIYSFGFRNPWRFSFDSLTGDLWVGDVGQNQLEEIDVVEKGKNYGWGIMEGTLCYNPAIGCDQTGLELPVWNYTRNAGIAVIGGFVYRGSALPDLYGSYVYGDYGSGRIWALKYDGVTVQNTVVADTDLNIASFGVDQQNELYFTAYDGKVYKLTSTIIPEVPSTIALAFLIGTTLMLGLAVKLKKKRQQES